MERLINAGPRTFVRHPDLVEYFESVSGSRKESPEPKILADLREKHKSDNSEDGYRIDEFAIRLLAKSETGLSTFDLSVIIYVGIDPEQNGALVPLTQHEIWDLEDAGIIVKNSNRLLKLAPEVQEQFI